MHRASNLALDLEPRRGRPWRGPIPSAPTALNACGDEESCCASMRLPGGAFPMGRGSETCTGCVPSATMTRAQGVVGAWLHRGFGRRARLRTSRHQHGRAEHSCKGRESQERRYLRNASPHRAARASRWSVHTARPMATSSLPARRLEESHAGFVQAPRQVRDTVCRSGPDVRHDG